VKTCDELVIGLHNRPDLANCSGGYAIQTVGKNGDPHRFQFKETLLNERSCMFSFSAHRSQFERKIVELDSEELLDNDTVMSDFCASVEFSIGSVLTRRLLRAIEFLNRKELWGNDNFRPKSVAVSGGVACNQRIRSMINHACKVSDCEAVFPPPQYCTDNGVMIAWNGVEKWRKNADLIPWNRVFDVDVQPRVPFGVNRIQDVIDAHIPNRKINFNDL
jgi:N6-L-threonylcarbamoyladenine synthase